MAERTDAIERRRAQGRAYYHRNKEKIAQRNKERREADPEKERQRCREYYAKNSERILGYKKKHREKYRERYKKRARDRRRNNPDEARAYNLKVKYGISIEQYDEILGSQGGVCAICEKPENGRLLAVDHCHDTGAVRGLLCAGCNTAIGRLNDDPALLARAINYLRGDL